MKRLRLSLVAILATILAPLGVYATSTDVTSTYLTNADFESATAIDNCVCTTYADRTKNNTTYSGLQSVTGWTESVKGNVESGNNRAGAVYAYGGTPFLGTSGCIAPTADNNGNTGNALGIVNVWSAEGYYSQAVTDLPTGVYTLTVYVYNTAGANAMTSRIGFVPTTGTATYGSTTNFTVKSWTKEAVTFTLTEKTSGTITLGFLSNGSGSSVNPHLFFDNVTLQVDEDYSAELIAATTALSNSDYTIVQGKARADLQTLVNSASSATTTAEKAALKVNLTTATKAFTDAKTSYTALQAAINAAPTFATADVTTEAKALMNSTSATVDEISSGANVLNVSEYNAAKKYYTNVKLGTWTTNTLVTKTDKEHWNGLSSSNYKEQQSGDWGSSSWNRTMSQTISLPVGKYVLMAAGRSETSTTAYMSVKIGDNDAVKVSFPSKGGSGYGINTSGIADFNSSDTYAKSNKGYGWEWRYIPFEITTASSVTVEIGGSASTKYQWMSFCDFSLYKYVDMTTAAADNGIDVTGKINNPSFFDDNKTGWTETGTTTSYNTGTTSNIEFFCTAASANFDFNQKISTLPAGYYKLQVQGYDRNSGNSSIADNSKYIAATEALGSKLYVTTTDGANTTTKSTYMQSMYSESPTKLPTSMAEAQTAFTSGNYDDNSITFYQPTDNNDVTIGVSNASGAEGE